jgi:hypothetical protein
VVDVQPKLGRCEITVHPELEERLTFQSSPLVNPELGKLIGSMFLTQPPIKTLGIYIPGKTEGGLDLMVKNCNAGGVRIGDSLSEQKQFLNKAFSAWRNDVQKQKKLVSEPEWTKFSYPWQRSNIVWRPGFPKLVMFLESSESSTPTLAKASYLESEDFYELRRNEWYEPLERFA